MNQIWSTGSNSTDSSSFTIGASAGVSSSGPSVSANASYTQGTSSTDSSSTQTNAVTFTSTPSCTTNDDGLCDSISFVQKLKPYSITSTLFDASFTKSGTSFVRGTDVVGITLYDEAKTYPSFNSTTIRPSEVHTGNITYNSYFYVVKPKSAVLEQTDTETLNITFDMEYVYAYSIRKSASSGDWGLCSDDLSPYTDFYPFTKTTTATYSTLSADMSSASFQTSLNDVLLGNNGTMKTITANLLTTLADNSDYDSGCTSASLQKELIVPVISNFQSPSLPTKKDGSLASIDSEEECRLVCYLSTDCVWSRWGYNEGDPLPASCDENSTDPNCQEPASYCQHSTDTCGTITLAADEASCDSSDNFDYYYNKVAIDGASTVAPYNIVSGVEATGTTRVYAYYQGNCGDALLD